MSVPFFRSIRFRLTVWYSTLLAVFLIAFSGITYGVVVGILRQQQIAMEQESVHLNLTSPMGDRIAIEVPPRVLGKRLQTLGCPRGVVRPDRRCTTMARPSAPQPDGVPESPPLPIRVPAGGAQRTDIVQAGFDEQTQQDILRSLFRFLLTMVPALLLLSLVGGGLLAHYALAPIGVITRAARRIRAGDVRERIRLRGSNDELKELADTFDDMVANLAAMLERERRFASDASHELQTPLAVIRTTADVARGELGLPADARDALDSITDGADRMSRIVDDLLLLAAYGQEAARTDVPLRTLVTGVLAHLRPLGDRRGIPLRLARGPSVRVQTNRDRLERALAGIVENALKYTKEGSITVAVRETSGGVEISVADTGPGIAPEHLPHLFERFYRVDRGRSREAGGTGLGLAIADAAVRSLGGSIRVESTEGSGSTFTLSIPDGN